MMLRTTFLCGALATTLLCAADKSGPNAEADAQFGGYGYQQQGGYGGQQGGYGYQPPVPQYGGGGGGGGHGGGGHGGGYGNNGGGGGGHGGGYGNNGGGGHGGGGHGGGGHGGGYGGDNNKGTCEYKKCSVTIPITHTHFDEVEQTHEYPIIITTHIKTTGLSFTAGDTSTQVANCEQRTRDVTNVDFFTDTFRHTIHGCSPTVSDWVVTSFQPITTDLTITTCRTSTMDITAEKIKSWVTDVPTKTVIMVVQDHTHTKFIPHKTHIHHYVCTEAPVCGGKGGGGSYGGGHHPPPPPPQSYPPPQPAYGGGFF